MFSIATCSSQVDGNFGHFNKSFGVFLYRISANYKPTAAFSWKNETFSTPDSRFIPNSGVGLFQAHPYPVPTASPLAPLMPKVMFFVLKPQFSQVYKKWATF